MSGATDTQRVLAILRSRRFPLTTEKATQAAVAEAFDAEGIAYEREARLAKGDIVDFRLGGLVIEVKLAGAKRAIHRQCLRYCAHPEVEALILATARNLPLPGIAKPTFVVSLGRAWL